MKSEAYHLNQPLRLSGVAGWVGLAALLISALGGMQNSAQFFHSWLAAMIFCLSIALGALFFVMVFHLTGATWSIPVRRLLESLAATLPVLFFLFLPVLFGLEDLYHWSHGEQVAGDRLLQLKSPFLNVPFFIARTFFYFAVWIFLALRLHALSIAQDENRIKDAAAKMRRLSAGGMILFADHRHVRCF